MTSKSAFNAEEWSVIVNAPYLAALLIMAAERGGTVRETRAISRAYAEARAHHEDPLLEAILSTPPTLDPTSAPRTPADLHRAATATLRQAVGTLERVATEEEVNTYKRFVYHVAESVARAHRKGGFLGFGGTELSEHEQAALDEIAAIFDVPQSSRPHAGGARA